MLLSTLLCAALFGGVSLGLAWPAVARSKLSPAEKIVASTALSLLVVFGWAWLVYVLTLPRVALWMFVPAAAGGLVFRATELRATLGDASVRVMLAAYGLFVLWCVGWLATVESYSGGGWVADWFEHWERTRFFLEHGPLDMRFIGRYALPARPPLANVVEGAFLSLTRLDFAHYQLFSTLFASLVFLPAALLALRWGGLRALGILLLLLLANPMVIENATFAWTKLPAAFFALGAAYFFLRTREEPDLRCLRLLCGACLGGGMLAHYSAGPYVIVIAAAWLVADGSSGRWKNVVIGGLVAGGLFALWIGWSVWALGPHMTFLSNPSVTSSDAQQGNQFVKIGQNLFDTLVPHFLRTLDTGLIAQRSVCGAARDWFFQCYQLNLLLAFGSVAWIALAAQLWLAGKAHPARSRNAWALAILALILLGVATHGQRDHWGLAHICLQPLVIGGLAFLAARWGSMTAIWRIVIGVGAVFDFAFGIVLHFGVQGFVLDRDFDGFSETALMNLNAKIAHRLIFFADALALPWPLVTVFVAIVLLAALRLAQRCCRAG